MKWVGGGVGVGIAVGGGGVRWGIFRGVNGW